MFCFESRLTQFSDFRKNVGYLHKKATSRPEVSYGAVIKLQIMLA